MQSKPKNISPPQTVSFVETLKGHIGIAHHNIKIRHLKLTIDTDSQTEQGSMTASIDSGWLQAHELLNEDLAVIKGDFVLFSTAPNGATSMTYQMYLRGIKTGTIYELQAEKHLAQRKMMLWNLLDIWPDTTTINLRLWKQTGKETISRELLGIGLVKITIPAFLRQLCTLRTNPQLSIWKRQRVLWRFLNYFSSSLWRVYIKQSPIRNPAISE